MGGGNVFLATPFLGLQWKWLVYAWDGKEFNENILSYGITKEGPSKIFDVRPKFSKGKADYERCMTDNECTSMTCAKGGQPLTEADSSMYDTRCRPNAGWKLKESCKLPEDCQLANGEYCMDQSSLVQGGMRCTKMEK